MQEREAASSHPRGRLATILWRWSQTRNLLWQTLRHMQMDSADCAFFVSAGIALFLLQVEPVLWGGPPSESGDPWRSPFKGLGLVPFEGLTADQTHLFPWIVVGVSVVNAWLLTQGMRRFGGADVAFRGWVLHLRSILAAPPFLGLCAFPLWRAVMDSRPAWALRRRNPVLSLGGPVAEAKGSGDGWRALRDVLDRLGSSSWFLAFWVVAVNLFALRAGLAWLAVPERQTPGVLLLLGAGRVILRCLGLFSLSYYLVQRTRGQGLPWRKRLFQGVVLLSWLMPQTSSFLLSFFVYIQLEEKRIETAVHGAFSLTGSKPGVLQEAGRGGDGIPMPLQWLLGSLGNSEAGSETLARKLGFYRMKTFLLLFDTGALVLVGLWLAKRFSWLDLPIGVGLAILAGSLLLSLAVSLVFGIWTFALHFFRPDSWQREQDRHPAMRYAFLSSLAVAWAFMTGVPASEKDTASLSFGLTVGMMVCALALVFLLPGLLRKLMGRSEERGLGPILWLLVFQVMGQLGTEMGKSPEMARGLTQLAYRVVLLTPVWALLLWGFRGSWVLRPFRLRDLFNPQLSPGCRWRIGLIALSSAMPMGGLAIPLWIRWLRRMEPGPLTAASSAEQPRFAAQQSTAS